MARPERRKRLETNIEAPPRTGSVGEGRGYLTGPAAMEVEKFELFPLVPRISVPPRRIIGKVDRRGWRPSERCGFE